MSTVSASNVRPIARAVRHPLRQPEAGDAWFWCDALGAGVAHMADLAAPLDSMSSSIARLPRGGAATRPAAAAYVAAVSSLASAWVSQLRPALQIAAHALSGAGNGTGGPGGRAASATRAGSGMPAGPSAAMLKRMAHAVALLDELCAAHGQEIERVAEATYALERDTAQATERLQADQVHALLLSQQASTLQAKLDDATMRQHAYWLLGPHAEQLRQEIAMHSSAREGVRRQLDHLRREQAATLAEAHYLHQLLPSLSTYLGALDRVGGALRQLLDASRALLHRWRALQSGQATVAQASLREQFEAAAPHWHALQASVRRLGRPVQGAGVTTPDGCRT